MRFRKGDIVQIKPENLINKNAKQQIRFGPITVKTCYHLGYDTFWMPRYSLMIGEIVFARKKFNNVYEITSDRGEYWWHEDWLELVKRKNYKWHEKLLLYIVLGDDYEDYNCL